MPKHAPNTQPGPGGDKEVTRDHPARCCTGCSDSGNAARGRFSPELLPEREKIEKLASLARLPHTAREPGTAALRASSPDLYFPLMDLGECRLRLKLHKMNRKYVG